MSPTSAPCRKRSYQPDIAAFFPRSAILSSSLPIRDASAPEQTPQNVLPSYVQSSLLNVGMRVRKAVPGGYLRHKMLEEDKENAYTAQTIENMLPNPQHNPPQRPRELQPYASSPLKTGNAIHDIGGWGAQPASTRQAAFECWSEEDTTPLSSQESTSSAYSVPERSRKRALPDEDEEDLQVLNEAREQPPAGYDASRVMLQQRVLSRPKHRNRIRRRGGVGVYRPPVEISDFGDAEFLRPREEMDVT